MLRHVRYRSIQIFTGKFGLYALRMSYIVIVQDLLKWGIELDVSEVDPDVRIGANSALSLTRKHARNNIVSLLLEASAFDDEYYC